MNKVSCAIYTRKSTDEGLDQAFNSLDAQREACEAYIKSQKHQGWKVLAQHYDDGGVSGGTMERPALQRLLEEVDAGRIDMIVVYKIDRLTRSLADFAKLVDDWTAQEHPLSPSHSSSIRRPAWGGSRSTCFCPLRSSNGRSQPNASETR